MSSRPCRAVAYGRPRPVRRRPQRVRQWRRCMRVKTTITMAMVMILVAAGVMATAVMMGMVG